MNIIKLIKPLFCEHQLDLENPIVQPYVDSNKHYFIKYRCYKCGKVFTENFKLEE